MPAEWRIEYWPVCEKHAFLSHCAEDRETLVVPVFRELQRRGIVAWLDRHHWPIARNALELLREELLKCRHVVYFITPAMLRQGRGWASAERAFSEAIQGRLVYGGELVHVELPLLFVPEVDECVQRSVWRSLSEKWNVCPHLVRAAWQARISQCVFGIDNGRRRWSSEHVEWAVGKIEEFIHQQDRWALDLADRYRQDSALRQHFNHERNLVDRLLGQSPPSFPQV